MPATELNSMVIANNELEMLLHWSGGYLFKVIFTVYLEGWENHRTLVRRSLGPHLDWNLFAVYFHLEVLQPCKKETWSVLRKDSSDRAVNTLFVRYKNRSVNVAKRTGC
jgi:hypothetical protein